MNKICVLVPLVLMTLGNVLRAQNASASPISGPDAFAVGAVQPRKCVPGPTTQNLQHFREDTDRDLCG